MKLNKKTLVRGSLSCFNLGMKYWIPNPFKYEVCTVMYIPSNKWGRMKYYNSKSWRK